MIKIVITKSTSNILYRLLMKVNDVVSTWRMCGFYVQFLKKLTFAKRTGNNNCILVPDTNHYRQHKESK